MSVTLASSSIFDTFNKSDSKWMLCCMGIVIPLIPSDVLWRWRRLKAINELKVSPQWEDAQSDWNGAADANANANAGEKVEKLEKGGPGVWSFWSKSAVERFTELENVDHAIAMGCVLKICLKDAGGAGGYTSTASVDVLKKLRYGKSADQGHPSIPVAQGKEEGTLPYNVHARPLGNVIYLMSSLNSPPKVLRSAEEVLYKAVKEAQ